MMNGDLFQSLFSSLLRDGCIPPTDTLVEMCISILEETLQEIFCVPSSLPHMKIFVLHEIEDIVKKITYELQSAISLIFEREATPFSLHSQSELYKKIATAKILPLRAKLRDSSYSVHSASPVVSLLRVESVLNEYECIPFDDAIARDMIILLSTYGHQVLKRIIDEIPMTIEIYLFHEKIPQLLRKSFTSLIDRDLESILYEDPDVKLLRKYFTEKVKEMERAERKLFLIGCMQGTERCKIFENKKKDGTGKRKRDESEDFFEKSEEQNIDQNDQNETTQNMEMVDDSNSDTEREKSQSLKESEENEISSVSNIEMTIITEEVRNEEIETFE